MTNIIKTLTAATCAILALGQSGGASAAGNLASDMGLQFARYANAVSHTGQGDANAVRKVTLASGNFDTVLNVALHGGQYQNCTYAPPSQAAQAQLSNVTQIWRHYQQLGDAIQQNQTAMQRYAEATQSIVKNTPDLLELAEQSAALIVMENNPLTNVAAGAQLQMLVVRLNNSANLVLLQPYVSPEAAFLIGKDSNQIHDIIQALLNGSKVLRTTAVKGNARDRLVKLDKAFESDIEARDAFMKNLQAAIVVKNAGAEIDARSDEFLRQIQVLAGSLPPAQDCR